MNTLVEQARGCGYRKPKGLYLVGGKLGSPCGKLPIPLTVCPCCNAGIKPTRGFQWIGRALIADAKCSYTKPQSFGGLTGYAVCDGCMWEGSRTHYGLMWTGEKFYPTPASFMKEAHMQGISKRISAMPKEFVIGEDWVLLAHRKAVKTVGEDGDFKMMPGIFAAFKPERIEYVCAGDETPEEIKRLEKRGLTLVKVIRDIDAQTVIEDVANV